MTERPLIVIDCWLMRVLVCLLNQLCYTGGVHIKNGRKRDHHPDSEQQQCIAYTRPQVNALSTETKCVTPTKRKPNSPWPSSKDEAIRNTQRNAHTIAPSATDGI